MSSTKPAKSCGPNQNAERLKAQGNELHQQGQYRLAYLKYSEAIKEDPTNAIYYSNRAACSLALKEFLDAAADAKKATKFDPKYAKAWSRLATAFFGLSSWSESVGAWKTALRCLPSEDKSTETDKGLRAQFTAGLKRAENALIAPIDQANFLHTRSLNEMPWIKAQALEKELVDAKQISSGLVILHAYRDFQSGVDVMEKLEKKMWNGQMCWVGKPNGLEDISNGVMRDPRVFNMDCSDWMEKYNKQVVFEAQMHRAWTEGGPNLVKEEAVQRLKRESWNSVRPALATTVRAWLMCGFMAGNFSRNFVAVEYYSRAVDVLDWGSRLWEGIPVEDRGVIFEKLFVRGVKRMHLSALHKCFLENITDCPITADELAELSRDLIAETDANLPPADAPIDAAYLASFWIYPRAEALSTLAWYHTQRGLAALTPEEANAEFTDAAKYYVQAAETYPPDDENVPYFLNIALEAYWWMPKGKQLKDTLPLMMRIHKSLPLCLKFWEKSALSKELDPQLEQVLNFALECGQALRQGKISLTDVVKPKIIKAQDKWGGANVVYL